MEQHKKTKKEETVSKEQHLRLAADFDNYRKIAERQMEDVVKFGQVGLLTEFLDVMDVLDRAANTAPESVRSDEWFAGLEQVRAQCAALLKKFNIRRLETVGKDLDPATMEVISTVPGGTSHQIKEEVRAGYLLHDRVIRPARVIVYQ